MVRHVTALAWLIAWLIIMAPRAATACSCMAIGPACEAFWRADAVFDATVSSIEPPAARVESGDRSVALNDKRVHVVVRQAWRGVAPGPVEVLTSETGSLCGYDFKNGGRYLIFAQRSPSDGRLRVSICSLTREFDGKGDIADYLASLSRPSSGGWVFGTVKMLRRPSGSLRFTINPATEFQVGLRGAGHALTTTTAGGRFEFKDLLPATYQIDLTVPDAYSAQGSARTFEIPDPRACSQQDFAVSPATRVGVR
jgi:hypothetical protein